ncbi:TauD/TfdA dioxygenase family protein [Sneathiella sp.]|uniref:TauD/TfdA dioxygenase family protein n=1 Tax=Sneathiella sp. TaxID=1964365 RepID=UPI00356A6233
MSDLTLRKISPVIGCEVTGIDLSGSLSEQQASTLRQALEEHCVLFFPGQALEPDKQVEFAKLFGYVPEVPEAMLKVHKAHACVSVLENDADHPPTVNNWHSDRSFAAEPDFASMIQAVSTPEIGGDTIWCNMYALYEGLSDRMQNHLEGLTAVHDFMKLYERPAKKALWEGNKRDAMIAQQQHFPPVSHPMVWTNPKTGRKALFVNESFTRHIDGMSESESRNILGHLFEQAKTPEYQIRYKLKNGDAAMWDNRSTVHYAVADYYPNHRLMQRVTMQIKRQALFETNLEPESAAAGNRE